MIRIIYLDIDGTLRDEAQGVTAATVRALEQCRAGGLYIVLCTGRNPASIQADIRRLAVDGVIAGGGCYIRLGGRELYRRTFPRQTAADALEAAARLGLGLSVEAERRIFMNKGAAQYYRAEFDRKLAGRAAPDLALRGNGICYQDNIGELDLARTPVHKICLLGEAAPLVERALAGRCQTVQRSDGYRELLPPGCSKGSGVRLVNRTLHIAQADSLCFGDGENDLDMFEAAGVRVAVRGGCPALVRRADSLCEPPAESGIARELERRRILPAREQKGA